MEKWSITDVKNWLLATEQLSTNSKHPVIGLTGADILELVGDDEAMTDLFQGYPSRADGGPSMSIFKIRVRGDKLKDASLYHASSNAPVLRALMTPTSVDSVGRRGTDSSSIDSSFGAGDTLRSSSNVSVASVVSMFSDSANDTAKGSDATAEESDGTVDVDDSTVEAITSKTQSAIALHVAMYNAVHGTDESLVTTAEGESTCDLCSTVMQWAPAEGPRTTSRHFESKKHVDARAKQKKAVVQDRAHTVGDMHAVLGLPLVRGIKAISSVSLTPRADDQGHLAGLACGCGKLLRATTVFMAIGGAQKHICVKNSTRKRPMKPVNMNKQKNQKVNGNPHSTNKEAIVSDGAGEEQEEETVEDASAAATPTRHSTQRTLHESFAMTPPNILSTSSSSSSSRPVSSATPSSSAASSSSALSASTVQRGTTSKPKPKDGKRERTLN